MVTPFEEHRLNQKQFAPVAKPTGSSNPVYYALELVRFATATNFSNDALETSLTRTPSTHGPISIGRDECGRKMSLQAESDGRFRTGRFPLFSGFEK